MSRRQVLINKLRIKYKDAYLGLWKVEDLSNRQVLKQFGWREKDGNVH